MLNQTARDVSLTFLVDLNLHTHETEKPDPLGVMELQSNAPVASRFVSEEAVIVPPVQMKSVPDARKVLGEQDVGDVVVGTTHGLIEYFYPDVIGAKRR